jgi:CRP-like cAMP-binding protein
MRKVLYIFGLLDDSDVETMVKLGRRRTLAAGEVLITQGQRLDRLYILLSGHMEVSVADLGQVAVLGSGEMLGEMAFVDDAPTSASVTALDQISLLELARDGLEACFVTNPGFGMRFYKAISVFLADRMRSTVARLGYGKGGALDDDALLEDELDERLLDGVAIAGERFVRLMRALTDARAE